MENVKEALDNLLEWWFIFSETGDIQDARALVDAIKEYDLSLQLEEEREI